MLHTPKHRLIARTGLQPWEKLNLSISGVSKGLPATPAEPRPGGKVARLQATGQRTSVIKYRAITTGKKVPAEHLEVGSRELDILSHRQGYLRIRRDCVLEASVAPQGRARWCTICPPAMWETTVWQTHTLAHSGVGRMTIRLQLTWFWPELTSTVRRLVKSCEMCQAAKSGRTRTARRKWRLYAGRP